MRLRALILAALAVGALAPAAGAVSPAAALPRADALNAGLGIRLVDAPTSLKDDPRARIYIIDHLKAGSTIKRHIAVTDSTGQPLSASVYVGGAAVKDGTFTPSDKGVPSELGSWSTVSPSSFSLKPRESKQALVTLAVPANAPDGERYGVIWAELPPSGSGPVKAVNRVGIRIYLSVGNGSAPPIDFAIQQLQAKRTTDGVPQVTATVHNTGGRALDMNGTLSLSDGPGGLSAGPYAAKLGTTLGIGETEPVTIVLPKAITGGPWKATLTLKSDTVSHTVTGNLTFPAAGQTGPPVQVTAKADSSSPWPYALGGGLGLLLLALLLFFLFKRRRRRDDEDEDPAAVAP